MSVFSFVKNIILYPILVKSLFLEPWNIYTDVKLVIAHFSNGNVGWGSLTIVCLLPSLTFPYHYFWFLKHSWHKFKVLFVKMNEVDFSEEKEKVKCLEGISTEKKRGRERDRGKDRQSGEDRGGEGGGNGEE